MSEDIETEVTRLNHETLRLYVAGQYQEALRTAEQAVALARQQLPSDPLAATAINNLAAVYQKLTRYDEADACYAEMIALVQAAAGDEHPMIGNVLHGRGLLCLSRGKLADARLLLERAVAHFQRFGESAQESLAATSNILGDVLRRLALLQKAEGPLIRSCAIREALVGPKHPDYARSLWNLALLRKDEGRFSDAERLYLQALAIFEQAHSEGHPDIGYTTSGLAGLYLAAGRYREALIQAERARDLVERSQASEHSRLAVALNILAATHAALGRPSEAIPLYERALSIWQDVMGPSSAEVAAVLINLADLRRESGDYASARRYLQRAISIFTDANLESHPNYARALTAACAVKHETGDLNGARDESRKALLVLERALGERHPDVTMARNNLAALELTLGDYAHAESLLSVSLSQASAPGEEHRPSEAAILNNLGMFWMAKGNASEAEQSFRRALVTREALVGASHPAIARILDNIALCCAATGRWDEALDLKERAFAIRSRVLNEVFVVASERQRLAHVYQLQDDLHGLLAMVVRSSVRARRSVRAAADAVLKRKSIIADALVVQREEILRRHYPGLGGRLARLQDLRVQIAARMREAQLENGGEREIERLLEEREAVERTLALEIPEASLGQRLQAADCDSVAAALPPGSVLVEFIVYRDFDFHLPVPPGEPRWGVPRLLAFVIPKQGGGEIEMIELGEAAVLNRLVAALSRGSRLSRTRDLTYGGLTHGEGRTEVDTAAEELRDRVVAPLMHAIGNCSRIFISPDGDLARVPFGTLPASDLTDLLDDYDFVYLSTGRDVLRLEVGRFRTPGLPLLIGDPDFDAWGPPGLIAGAERFDRLPETADEVKFVGEILGVTPLTGKSAVERAVRGRESPRILHLATHGFFKPIRQLRERSGGREPGPLDQHPGRRTLVPPEIENSLLRSGVALAGANTWLAGGELPAEAEDGLLYAEDVAGLDLTDTDLVVLSACKTALGEVDPGEGVLGLQRSFAVAGAKRVVMSMWPVPDRETKELMTAFYQGIAEGLGCSEALRKAQLHMRGKHPDVAYWGAFVCQGNPGPISLSAAV